MSFKGETFFSLSIILHCFITNSFRNIKTKLLNRMHSLASIPNRKRKKIQETKHFGIELN